MKKTIIVGAASAVLAAMPVLGVFADVDGDLKVTDTVELTLTQNCKFGASAESTGSNKNKVTLSGDGISGTFGGENGEGGSAMTVSCNLPKGWTLSANAPSLVSGSDNIEFGKIDSANTTTSAWSAMVKLTPPEAGTSSVEILGGWDSFTADKTVSNGTIVQAKGSADNKAGIEGLTITPYYKAFVAEGQHAGTYTGDVVYTLHANQ